MRRKLPLRNPVAAYGRKAIAERRVGNNSQCACGENRPEALIPQSKPTICAACKRIANGQSTWDRHHPAGKANNPATIPVPVNDHRTWLSVAQHDWPKETRENPDGSPLLAAAASIRGYMDTDSYLIEKLLLRNPEMLERLDAFLVKELGPKWWVSTELEQFAPKRKANGKT